MKVVFHLRVCPLLNEKFSVPVRIHFHFCMNKRLSNPFAETATKQRFYDADELKYHPTTLKFKPRISGPLVHTSDKILE